MIATMTAQATINAMVTVEAYRSSPPIGTWGKVGSSASVAVGDFRYIRKIGYTSAGSNSRFIAFGVRVENLSFLSLTVSLFDFTLVDLDGRTYTPDDTMFIYWSRPLGVTEVLPGNSVQGGLVFHLPDSTGPAIVVYHGGLFGLIEIDITQPPLSND